MKNDRYYKRKSSGSVIFYLTLSFTVLQTFLIPLQRQSRRRLIETRREQDIQAIRAKYKRKGKQEEEEAQKKKRESSLTKGDV